MDNFILSEKETMDSQSTRQDYFAEQDTGRSIPSRIDETVPVVHGTEFLISFASCGRQPFANM